MQTSLTPLKLDDAHCRLDWVTAFFPSDPEAYIWNVNICCSGADTDFRIGMKAPSVFVTTYYPLALGLNSCRLNSGLP